MDRAALSFYRAEVSKMDCFPRAGQFSTGVTVAQVVYVPAEPCDKCWSTRLVIQPIAP
jgi:hypothetical protein